MYNEFNRLKNLAKTLAPSQGFYGRLLNKLNKASNQQKEQINNAMKEAKLKDDVDIILWLEG